MHAEILEHFRDDKVIIFKMKAKKHYRKKAVSNISGTPRAAWRRQIRPEFTRMARHPRGSERPFVLVSCRATGKR